MNANVRSFLIIFVAVLASLLEVLDTSIVNVIIPTMMGNLGVSLDDISAVITGYAVANAVVLPAAAWASSKIGKRKYYLSCIAIFTLTSFACGISPNLETLVIFRILQGLAGGALLPTSQDLIFNEFPKEKSGYAGAVMGVSILVGPTLGPVLGGYLTDHFGWRSVFNVNIPLGILALVIGLFVINDDTYDVDGYSLTETKHKKIDTFGLAMLCSGIGCLQYVLERGEANDWFASNSILICTVICVTSLILFVWWELKVENPIVDIRLFKHNHLTLGVLLIGGVGFFIYSSLFITPVFIDKVFHYSVTETGILFIPGSLLTMAMMPVAGYFTDKTNPKFLIALGFVTVSLCLWYMSTFSASTTEGDMLFALYIRGFAMGFLFLPITAAVLAQFSGYEMAQVSGLLNLFRQIGGSFSIALVNTVLSGGIHQSYLSLTSKVSLLNQETQAALYQVYIASGTRMSSELGFASASTTAIAALSARVQLQAFVITFDKLMFITLIIILLCFIPLFFIKFKNRITGTVMTH